MSIRNPNSYLPTGPNTRPLLRIQIEEAQRNTNSNAAAARWLGVSYRRYRKYAQFYGLFEKHMNQEGFGVDKGFSKNPTAVPLKEILEGKHPNYSISKLKNRLIARKKLEAECNICGFNERRIRDGKIPLILQFLDGNHKNKKLDNMQLLCYNCMFLTTNVPLAAYRKGILRTFQSKAARLQTLPTTTADHFDPHDPLYQLSEADLEELYAETATANMHTEEEEESYDYLLDELSNTASS